ncbi:MAG TPA: hypothetical protein VG960_10795 [Caulobacteraceae bacterium]|nr:hypothetical protein [Caulobacteraceae bacterium]
MPNSGSLSIGGGEAIGSESPRTPQDPESKKTKRAAPTPAPKPSSGHRLVIDQDPRTGRWIYTVTDRDTGEIIARISREDVAKLGLKTDYAAGALIKAKA